MPVFVVGIVLASACAVFGCQDGARRFGVAKAPAHHPGTIRLATYNVENLYDDKDNPFFTGRNDDIQWTKPESELKALAKAIHEVNADILAMEEMESLDTLVWFRDTYLSDMGYRYVAALDAGGDTRGIECVLLSRYPVTGVKVWPGELLGGVHPEKYGSKQNWYAGEPIAFRRSPLRVDIEVRGLIDGRAEDFPTYHLTLFVLHHKSGRYSDYWREAEAKKVLSLVHDLERADPDRNIAIMGDFNAKSNAQSVRLYTDNGLTDLCDPARTGASPNDPAWITHESGRRIDYIMVNQALKPEIVDGSCFVLGTPARPAGADYRVTPPPRGYGSDHYPVVVDLTPRDRKD